MNVSTVFELAIAWEDKITDKNILILLLKNVSPIKGRVKVLPGTSGILGTQHQDYDSSLAHLDAASRHCHGRPRLLCSLATSIDRTA